MFVKFIRPRNLALAGGGGLDEGGEGALRDALRGRPEPEWWNNVCVIFIHPKNKVAICWS